jgi:hypothetical protein
MVDLTELAHRLGNKAAARRIADEVDAPYEGFMYDGPGGAARKGKYARLRLEDLTALLDELKVMG